VNDLEGHSRSLNCCYLTSHSSLPISGLHVSILHCFQESTTFTVYVTDCDLEKSFRIDETVQITSHVCFPIHIQFSMIFFCVTGLSNSKTNIGVIQQARCDFLLVFHCNYVSILYHFQDTISYLSNLMRSRDPERIPFGGNV